MLSGIVGYGTVSLSAFGEAYPSYADSMFHMYPFRVHILDTRCKRQENSTLCLPSSCHVFTANGLADKKNLLLFVLHNSSSYLT